MRTICNLALIPSLFLAFACSEEDPASPYPDANKQNIDTKKLEQTFMAVRRDRAERAVMWSLPKNWSIPNTRNAGGVNLLVHKNEKNKIV